MGLMSVGIALIHRFCFVRKAMDSLPIQVNEVMPIADSEPVLENEKDGPTDVAVVLQKTISSTSLVSSSPSTSESLGSLASSASDSTHDEQFFEILQSRRVKRRRLNERLEKYVA